MEVYGFDLVLYSRFHLLLTPMGEPNHKVPDCSMQLLYSRKRYILGIETHSAISEPEVRVIKIPLH